MIGTFTERRTSPRQHQFGHLTVDHTLWSWGGEILFPGPPDYELQPDNEDLIYACI